ncbi:uncharacterized protein SPAPADRAFT_131996 [Spathaspora passalidarum NRRL Y-27907]|uniref:21S rRNA pseudouridine(2819) synthase n=1 Tax=Spathaspora passalidarum (strain NRRL Y-27907 / 11-Y1) TaxID=619300 RepID=G3AET6_SPAPN|nr:uncharacterized protein SPAPADRAFT_131996 [Spathaspora passalidarum NRRL Y-27907]EGW35766.1 hypothetical protein SPAPADRAFT_131996 [Spathaspora passalidarum NRRL Y-27907]
MGKLDIVKHTFNYAIVNKSSNMICSGYQQSSLIPSLTQEFQQRNPEMTFDPAQFRICQRLDRFVTGGLIVARNRKWADKIRRVLGGKSQSMKLTRRYVGLIFGHDSLTSGVINYDIQALEKDYRGKPVSPRQLNTYPALTRFKLLTNLTRDPTPENILQYPDLFDNIQLMPIIFELHTGRKNQIRDHVIQAFKTPLLNDDQFIQFKMQSETGIFANSTKFIHNQIGLHSAILSMETNKGKEDFVFPIVAQKDRILWQGFVDDNGILLPEIIKELKLFTH